MTATATSTASIEDCYAAWNTSGRDNHPFFNLVRSAKAEGKLDLLFQLTFESESRSSRLVTTSSLQRYCYLMDAGLEHTPERDGIVGVQEYVVERFDDIVTVRNIMHSFGLTDAQREILELIRIHSFREHLGPLVIARGKILHQAVEQAAAATLKADLAAAQRKHDDAVRVDQANLQNITGFFSAC